MKKAKKLYTKVLNGVTMNKEVFNQKNKYFLDNSFLIHGSGNDNFDKIIRCFNKHSGVIWQDHFQGYACYAKDSFLIDDLRDSSIKLVEMANQGNSAATIKMLSVSENIKPCIKFRVKTDKNPMSYFINGSECYGLACIVAVWNAIDYDALYFSVRKEFAEKKLPYFGTSLLR